MKRYEFKYWRENSLATHFVNADDILAAINTFRKEMECTIYCIKMILQVG